MAPSRAPSLLSPYISTPSSDALILLTNVLGASSNWLLLRFLWSALANDVIPAHGNPAETSLQQADDNVAVVFVSWARDWEFWRAEARRAVGLDLPRLAQRKRLVFVDGLTGLFASQQPVRGGPFRAASRELLPPASIRLASPSLAHLEDSVKQAISSINVDPEKPRKILLVLDSPDLLLATSPPGKNNISASSLSTSILHLRRLVHASIVTAAADSPLLSLSPTPTPLESSHASFVTGLAHSADWVMSARLLDTGFAKDVSGVLRITRGDPPGAQLEHRLQDRRTEREVLYFVGADGGVDVFERGAGNDVG